MPIFNLAVGIVCLSVSVNMFMEENKELGFLNLVCALSNFYICVI
ncbi:hypothetical protein SAMN02745176_03506 [Lutispora thermophila DSM 19022]|uniref:Uncharacterized protein n=1 Tax=Lutispora thermophila DSM 19022 TaxID=1122184 RepID=A0A1M6J4P8_9FIRM|nr:hypothetical protein SAMN02745176_03506 [Lutispora thermophila DSM 19022]